MLRSDDQDLRIHEITITEKSGLSGQTIAQSGLKERFGLLVLGLRRKPGDLEFNPPASEKIKTGMVLVVMGEVANIISARQSL